jgi:hypothetical protein
MKTLKPNFGTKVRMGAFLWTKFFRSGAVAKHRAASAGIFGERQGNSNGGQSDTDYARAASAKARVLI